VKRSSGLRSTLLSVTLPAETVGVIGRFCGVLSTIAAEIIPSVDLILMRIGSSMSVARIG
jgi:hypothetical protein